jgi:hypothetical protein
VATTAASKDYAHRPQREAEEAVRRSTSYDVANAIEVLPTSPLDDRVRWDALPAHIVVKHRRLAPIGSVISMWTRTPWRSGRARSRTRRQSTIW